MKNRILHFLLFSFILCASRASYGNVMTSTFASVADAQSHQWTEGELGSLVQTLAFNTDIRQHWRLVEGSALRPEQFALPAGAYFLQLEIKKDGVSLAELGGVPFDHDPSFDNVPVWETAQSLDVPILLDDFYAGFSTFYVVKSGLTVIGRSPADSGLVGQNTNQPVLMTRNPANLNTQSDLTLMDFAIQGKGAAAMVMTHMSVSKIDNISLSGFVGNDGFVFEYIWGNHIGLLKSNGANLSGAPFKWNQGVLDSVFGHLYSSNLVDINFDFDNSRQEYAQPQAGGDGVNTLVLLTAQGADRTAIKIHGLSRYKILNVYTENCEEILHITGNVSDVHISGDFQGVRASTQRAILLDGNLSGITLSDVSLPNNVIEIGKINADIYINSPRVTGNGDIVTLLRRNANTPSSMPLTIDYQGSSMSRKLLKTNGWSWKFRSMFVDNNGQWQSELITIPLI